MNKERERPMRDVIKKERVRVGESEGPSTPGGGASHAPVPGVRLVRLEGRVHAIEVTCRCGEVSLLEIEYEDATNRVETTP